jgi:hypothetical protein
MKQVAEVGPSGEALFDYAVFDGVRSGFDRVVFVVSDRSRPAVEEHVTAGMARHVATAFVEQDAGGRAKPWGTGHAVLTACAEVGGAPYAVVNADDFYGRRSYQALARGLAADGDDHVLVGFRLADTLTPNGGVSRGVIEVNGDVLTAIRELHDVAASDGGVTCREGVALTGDELISANLWGFRPSFCDALRTGFDGFRAARGDDPGAEFLIGDAVEQLRASGGPDVRVLPTPERFMGVTFREDLDDARATIAALVDAGEYPATLWP